MQLLKKFTAGVTMTASVLFTNIYPAMAAPTPISPAISYLLEEEPPLFDEHDLDSWLVHPEEVIDTWVTALP